MSAEDICNVYYDNRKMVAEIKNKVKEQENNRLEQQFDRKNNKERKERKMAMHSILKSPLGKELYEKYAKNLSDDLNGLEVMPLYVMC